MNSQQVAESLLAVGGAPLQVAALAWLVFRVEMLHRDYRELERRVVRLEGVKANE